jgi:LmbE family N-acetylglucosaminyl deacetylase
MIEPAERMENGGGRLLMVVAHPDDEYAFAGSTYRLTRESGWTADQVIITDGECGYRYAALAEMYYGVGLTHGGEGRARLGAIRKEEVQEAGRVLGIRDHHFLEQQDLGFESNAAAAETANWDRPRILASLTDLLQRNRYDVVLTLLPTVETHGHHRAATLLTLEAIASLPEDQRPLTLGVEPRAKSDEPLAFAGLADEPLSRTANRTPVITFDRCTPFGYRGALNYQIVVNWVIAAHKSQGLFQNDYGRHTHEQFWLFEASGRRAMQRLPELQHLLTASLHAAAA